MNYREVQQFNQPWLWVMMGLVNLVFIVVFGYGVVRQLTLGELWGTSPMSDTGLLVVGAIMILGTLAITWMLFRMKLIVEVNNREVFIKMRPFLKRLIAFSEIDECQSQQYEPLREYVGWGIRWGRNGMAYNIRGDHGVRLKLKNGKNLLIGSQRSEELAAAIREGLEST